MPGVAAEQARRGMQQERQQHAVGPGCGDRLVAVELPPEPSQELLVASVVVLDVAEELVVR
jgi:hypothetical protein